MRGSPREGRHRAFLVLGWSALVVALAVVATLAGRSSAAPLLDVAASGSLSVTNSLHGQAILSVPALAPGHSASGTVTIANTGSLPGALVLTSTGLSDLPGVGGGTLSSALDLHITDVTSGSDGPIWSGKLAGMPALPLVTLPPGDHRAYRFDVALPDGGTPDQTWNGDNVLQGASTRVDYRWTLTQTAAAACSGQIRGNQRPNRLIGTSAGDRILGLGGADRIEAMAGDDCARGGNGADRVLGGPGSDRLSGGRGPDLLKGGRGDDVIFARGGGVDRVQCGPGRDRAVVDRWDHVRGCEAVRRPGRWIP